MEIDNNIFDRIVKNIVRVNFLLLSYCAIEYEEFVLSFDNRALKT